MRCVMWKKWFDIVLPVFLLLWATAGGVFASDGCERLLGNGLSGERQWKNFYNECLDTKPNVEEHAQKLMGYFRGASGRNDGSYPSPGHIDDFLARMNTFGLLARTSTDAGRERDVCEIVRLMRPKGEEWKGKKQDWNDKIGCGNDGTGVALKPESDLTATAPESGGWMNFPVFLLFAIVAGIIVFVWESKREIEGINRYLSARDAGNRKKAPDITGEQLARIQDDIATLGASVEAIRDDVKKLQGTASNQKATPRADKKPGWDALYERLLAADTRQAIEKALSDTQARYNFSSAIGAVGRPSGREGLYFFDTKPTDEDNRGLYAILNPKKDLYYLIPCGIRNRVTNPWLNLLYTIDKDTIAIRQLKTPTQIKIVKTADKNTTNSDTANHLIYFSLGKTGELL
uniref:Uncharacterized protein n=1 Tax=Candidatus Kentrum eta TaxID=2126337 RepID=A0A450V1B1_9GAMM|nr:MAG: hypothetical protein BECKH772A_GA0070896_100267 [Candidatus Kentron sp. H]VFJ92015.1 MAG: hypothetical protein BECKH772B_GA0070898_100247 [Candidatus Kentron sp. H]VFJ98600.1 MAG: hypothetical protein BECKH772C_GA0070978_100237 [Candidatus Kentron sp. H]